MPEMVQQEIRKLREHLAGLEERQRELEFGVPSERSLAERVRNSLHLSDCWKAIAQLKLGSLSTV